MNERISLMDRFQMNRSGCRPYQYTCGMNGGMAARERLFIFRYGKSRQPERESLQQHEANMPKETCSCNMPGTGNRADQEMYSHLKHLGSCNGLCAMPGICTYV